MNTDFILEQQVIDMSETIDDMHEENDRLNSSIERLMFAAVETGMMNRRFAEWIRDGLVTEQDVANAIRNFQTAMHPKPISVESKYVVGFLFDTNRDKVLLILKTHPEWQAGRYNGIGGKIEQDETAEEAMIREFREETGLMIDTIHWQLAGVCGRPASVERQPGSFRMHVFTASIDNLEDLHRQIPQDELEEKVILFDALDLSEIRRVGVPELATLVDLCQGALVRNFTFTIDHITRFHE